ncbi:hypothetical protein HK100_001667 [Physocladia obscura]|uniref:Photolyase/cryptochrome alpha/beta domain-containing protein n=1 Tax=Physocladia obscura TaxID=109957 RepID=A0AAD5XBM9_9FUNG|nr:hypothetical protein HK100_001667 [Physocladia obscura]
MTSDIRVMFWFRTDLRLHDSPALQAALSLNPSALFPVWCWDPNYVYKHRVGINRFRFLLESMQTLSDRITEIEPNSQLLVVRGEPTYLLPLLWSRWRITHLVFEKDTSAYGRRRDAAILAAAKTASVIVVAVQGHHLYDPEEVTRRNKGKPTMTISSLQKIADGIGNVPKPLPAPQSLPLPKLTSNLSKRNELLLALAESLKGITNFAVSDDIDLNSSAFGGQRTEKVNCYDSIDGGNGEFSVPSIQSIGMETIENERGNNNDSFKIKGGEAEALTRLEKLCKKPDYIATFSKPNTSPGNSIQDASTTLLSPYLKFGCLGVRKMWWDIEEAKKKYKGTKTTTPPQNLNGQLLFRDMYACAEFAVGDNFTRIRVYDSEGVSITPRPLGDAVSEQRLAAFKEGRTGFPWIDALMRQLKQEGWMHHLGRHSVAAFLTRGQCWISWERGAEIFDEYLIDWDPCSNPGNWMWLSCSAFYSQYFKLYGLVSFPSKYDASGKLVRQYCPELANFPDKFIYEPHAAPLKIQKKAGCIIGVDYPAPILDEKKQKEENMVRMKACFAKQFYGTSEEVLNGTADEILKGSHGISLPSNAKEISSTTPWTIAASKNSTSKLKRKASTEETK